MREIVLDTETTGLDPQDGHRIVEIGAVELYNHLPTGKVYHQYINPVISMPDQAFAIHGLSDEFLSDKPIFSEIADDFLDFIGSAKLVIHNAAFDIKFINAELKNIEQVYYPLVVTNGDIIFEDNISSILENFQEQNIDGLMLCREEHNLIPYGVVESDLDSNFINIKEKPKYNYLVNGGIYILSKKILDLIKEGENLDMPELYMRAKSKDYIVKIFTLKEYWIDVGRVDNLEMANRKFN